MNSFLKPLVDDVNKLWEGVCMRTKYKYVNNCP